MGGGGGGRQVTETSQVIPSELRGAYAAMGDLAENFAGAMGGMPEMMGDATVQQVAGPTGIENLAYQQQQGLMESGGPQAWSDAMGMFSALGSLPAYGGVDLSGIQGWGAGAGAPAAPPPAPGRRVPSGGAEQFQAMPMKMMMAPEHNGGGGGGGGRRGGGGGGGGGGGAPGGGGFDPGGGGEPIPGVTPGSAAMDAPTPEGGVAPPWTQATQHPGIAATGMGQGPQSGQVREVEAFDMADWMSQAGGGGGGGGRSSFSASSGGGAPVAGEERIGDVLSEIDFANHPALASALETFAATALPGIENSMIGAGLGRSGAAANAISTGKAQMALPVMQQLIQGELTQRGQDVTQRGQDVQANIASAQAAAQARAQGASLQQQRYMADLAHAQVMRGQDINMRGQDIGLRGQDINALLQQGAQGLQARGQDIGALVSGAQGLSSLGGADLARIQQNIAGGMSMGGAFRDIANQQGEAEFLAGEREWDRGMEILGPLMGGAMGSGGTRTTTTGGGGGK